MNNTPDPTYITYTYTGSGSTSTPLNPADMVVSNVSYEPSLHINDLCGVAEFTEQVLSKTNIAKIVLEVLKLAHDNVALAEKLTSPEEEERHLANLIVSYRKSISEPR